MLPTPRRGLAERASLRAGTLAIAQLVVQMLRTVVDPDRAVQAG